jgi:hypothetical protein
VKPDKASSRAICSRLFPPWSAATLTIEHP